MIVTQGPQGRWTKDMTMESEDVSKSAKSTQLGNHIIGLYTLFKLFRQVHRAR